MIVYPQMISISITKMYLFCLRIAQIIQRNFNEFMTANFMTQVQMFLEHFIIMCKDIFWKKKFHHFPQNVL